MSNPGNLMDEVRARHAELRAKYLDANARHDRIAMGFIARQMNVERRRAWLMKCYEDRARATT